MPKLVLSTLMLLVLNCGLSMADECKVPKIVQGEIKYKEPSSNTSQVIFTKYSLNIPIPTKTIFSNDILIYIYGEGETRKVLSIQALPDTLKDSNNKYNATKAYKLAIGLDNNENADDFILNIRRGFQLCNAEVTKYSFNGINTPIIKTNMTIAGDKDTDFFIFGNIEPFIDMVQFSNFTNEEINKIMSTFQLVNNKGVK